MSLPQRLSRCDSAPNLYQSKATMSSTEDLDIIDSIIEKAVNAIGTLEDDLRQANATIARQQRNINELSGKSSVYDEDVARMRPDCDCSDRIKELEDRLKSESQAYDKLRETTNSLLRKVRDLTSKQRDKEKQQKDAEIEWEAERQRLHKQVDEAQSHEFTGEQKENERLKEECAALRKMNNTNREAVAGLRERLERIMPLLAEKGLL